MNLPFLSNEVLFFPIIQDRIEFTILLNQYLNENKPDIICMALPEAIQSKFRKSVKQTPLITVIQSDYEVEKKGINPKVNLESVDNVGSHINENKPKPDLESTFRILSPANSYIEAARYAEDNQIPWRLIAPVLTQELSSLSRLYEFYLPDPYVLDKMDIALYYKLSLRLLKNKMPFAELTDCFKMAVLYFLTAKKLYNQSKVAKSILFIAPLHYGESVSKILQAFQKEAEEEILRQLAQDSLNKVMRIYHQDKLSSEFVDTINRDDKLIMEPQYARMDSIIQKFMLETRDRKYRAVSLKSLNPKSVRKLLPNIPYFVQLWEEKRLNGNKAVDKNKKFQSNFIKLHIYNELIDLYEKARINHLKNSKEEIPYAYIKKIISYLKRWTYLNGKLFPELYQVVQTAFSFWDNNFAYEVWDLATNYEYIDKFALNPDIELDFEDLGLSSKRLPAFRDPKLPEQNRRLSLMQRRKQALSGKWKRDFSAEGSCSYPPEDIIIEDYGQYLQKMATALMKSNRQRTFPFSASFMDGLDYRETVRKIHTGNIYVRQEDESGGKAGSVVIIYHLEKKNYSSHQMFGADTEDKYSYEMTWWGEHDQESDMAFYSTPPEELVGPGIIRMEYGGLLLSYPPRRLHNIWEGFEGIQFRNRAERLLLAAILYNLEKNVVYVAPKAPEARMVSYAQRFGQRIIYIPISSLNPVMLGRIRRFHLLDSHSTRNIADDYIY